jgi:hypothetical protein
MAWSHNAMSLNADGATLALARLRRLKLLHPKSHAEFAQSLRNRCPTEEYHPCQTSLSTRVRWLRCCQSWEGPGIAKDAPPLHQGSSPIYNGFNHQPTQDKLRALHRQDVTPDQAREIDRLYDQLLSSSEKILRQHPALVR